MVNDPKLRAGLKFTHSSQTTSSDPQGVGELWREGSGGILKKIPSQGRSH